MKTEKEQIIEEITTYSLSYAKMYDLLKEGVWDEERLKYLEISSLKDKLRDIKTFERNKKQLNGGN